MTPTPSPQEPDWLREILDTHRSETWSTGWNNDATEKAHAAITARFAKLKEVSYQEGYDDCLREHGAIFIDNASPDQKTEALE